MTERNRKDLGGSEPRGNRPALAAVSSDTRPSQQGSSIEPTIYLLMKMFEEAKYAEDFIAGRLYMNPLQYFLSLERRCGAGDERGDQFEAAQAVYSPSRVVLSVAGRVIPAGDIASPILLHSDDLAAKNVFCLYSLNSRTHGSEDCTSLAALKAALRVDRRCDAFGEHCVVLTNATKFIERVMAAFRRDGLKCIQLGLVKYFDDASYSGRLDTPGLGFMKRGAFEWQSEYRILVDTGRSEPSPHVLNVGDLSDIALRLATSEFNDQLEVVLGDGPSKRR